MNTKMSLYFISFTLLLFLGSCEKDLTPLTTTQPEIKLTAEDVGVTEVWLKLEVRSEKKEVRITISRDETVTLGHFNTLTLDTLIYDSNLLPNQNYTYTATITTSDQNPVTSIQQLTTYRYAQEF